MDLKLGSQSRNGSSPDQWWSKRRRWRDSYTPKRTKNVNELQVAVMRWELTLVEHESKYSEVVADSEKTAAKRAMLPQGCAREIPRRTFPSRGTSKSCVCIRGREAGWTRCEPVELNPWALGRSTNPKEKDEDVNAVQQRRLHDRSNKKHKQESDSERKPLNRRTSNLSPSASRQSIPRDKKPGSDEMKLGAGKNKRLICYRCGGKGHPARLCPSVEDCQDVDEVGTEPSSDADSDLFGLDWGDDTPLQPSTQ